MTKKANALWHLNYVCPKCPKWRREMRTLHTNKKACFWFESWKNKNYKIPKGFGIRNKISQYLSLKTNLSKFQKWKLKE